MNVDARVHPYPDTGTCVTEYAVVNGNPVATKVLCSDYSPEVKERNESFDKGFGIFMLVVVTILIVSYLVSKLCKKLRRSESE